MSKVERDLSLLDRQGRADYYFILGKRDFREADAYRIALDGMHVRQRREGGTVSIGQAANSVLGRAIRRAGQ